MPNSNRREDRNRGDKVTENRGSKRNHRPELTEARKEMLEELKDQRFKCSICFQTLQPEYFSMRQLRRVELSEMRCLDCQEKRASESRPKVEEVRDRKPSEDQNINPHRKYRNRSENRNEDANQARKSRQRKRNELRRRPRPEQIECKSCNRNKSRFEYSQKELRYSDEHQKECIECTSKALGINIHRYKCTLCHKELLPPFFVHQHLTQKDLHSLHCIPCANAK